MNILKRSMAPLSKRIWKLIDETAVNVLATNLSARKSVHIRGPYGMDCVVVPEGRLELIQDKGLVRTGKHAVKPLVEARASFELNRWELDNIFRGAKDINFDKLEEAVKAIALFEENAVYNGYKEAKIEGLQVAAGHSLDYGKKASDILAAITEAKYILKSFGYNGPYDLVVGREAYKRLNSVFEGYPLYRTVRDIVNGRIILSEAVKGAFLFPTRHKDLELTVGQDFAIGYENHDSQSIKLFITESFTFRLLNENAVVRFYVEKE